MRIAVIVCRTARFRPKYHQQERKDKKKLLWTYLLKTLSSALCHAEHCASVSYKAVEIFSRTSWVLNIDGLDPAVSSYFGLKN